MLKLIETVFRFNHQVVGMEPKTKIEPLPFDDQYWLHKALTEEAQEFLEAKNPVDSVDALCDSIVFALGGFYRMGLSPIEALYCLEAVMESNLTKKAGQKEGRVVGEVKDAVKPEGWLGPEEAIAKILGVSHGRG